MGLCTSPFVVLTTSPVAQVPWDEIPAKSIGKPNKKQGKSSKVLSVLFNYIDPAPSDQRKPKENKPKHKENKTRLENFRFCVFSDFADYPIF